MALIFIDGFDHYDDDEDAAGKYDSVSSTVTTDTTEARTGIGAFKLSASGSQFTADVPDQTTYIIGYGFKLESTPQTLGVRDLLQFSEDNVPLGMHLALEMTGDRRFRVSNKSVGSEVVLGTTAEQFELWDGWHYIEFKVVVDSTSGSFELRFDEEIILSVSGVDTRNNNSGGHAPLGVIKKIRWREIEGAVDKTFFEDLYICDTTGTKNNDFLGDCQVTTIFPKADGALEDFTLSTGSDSFALVDDNPPDDDSTHVESNTIGHKDSFDMDDVASITTILGVQLTEYARFLTGSASIKHLARVGGTNYLGSIKVLAGTYDFHMHIYEDDPDISSEWTISGLNAAEFGMEVV